MMTADEICALDPTEWQHLVMGGPGALQSYRRRRERERAQLADQTPARTALSASVDTYELTRHR
jgi:hypothetical protein